MFTYEYINQGVTHWLFSGKYCLKVVRVKDYKIKEGGSITFQNRHKRNCECLNISNLVNTKVANLASLVFTTFEITKHPTFRQCLI